MLNRIARELPAAHPARLHAPRSIRPRGRPEGGGPVVLEYLELERDRGYF
jgi:hypothetical protein